MKPNGLLAGESVPSLPSLKPGDCVEVIAPASRCQEQHLDDLKRLMTSWQLQCIIKDNIFGDDLLCANSDEIRSQLLITALKDPNVKAIICARGGYGSMRLIPSLNTLPSFPPKLFIGMSDITTLNLFFQQQWRWPILHGSLSSTRFSPESTATIKAILFGEMKEIAFSTMPLNQQAEALKHHEAILTGGNLSIVQASIGTLWQLQAKNKIIFLEEINERGYRIDRILQHLIQANILKEAVAIIFGDFIGGNEPNGSSLVQPVLKRFATQCDIPVMQIQGIGHGYINYPIPLGTKAILNNQQLICSVWS